MVTKAERTEQIARLTADFGSASGLYFTAYETITVEKISRLRNDLRAVGGKFVVVKNSLAHKALEANNLSDLIPHVKGPVGVAIATTDMTGPAKVLKKFNSENGNVVEFKAAVIEGTVFVGADAAKLGDLPSREELYSMFLSCLQVPAQKFAAIVDAVREKREQES